MPHPTRARSLSGAGGEEGCACSGVHSTEPLGELQGLQGLRTVWGSEVPGAPEIFLFFSAVTATPLWDVKSKAQVGLAKRACTVLGLEVGEARRPLSC